MRKVTFAVAIAIALMMVTPFHALEAQLQFVNDADAAGVSHVGFGRGAAMVDFDGDGLLDLFAGNTGPDVIFRQLSDGTFEDMTTTWNIPVNDDPTWTVLASDFDNDGDPDLMLLTGGFVDREVPGMSFGGAGFGIDGLPNVMLRNDIDTLGTFTDVTADAGAVGTLITGVFGGTAADYDHDGDLDVFLSNQPETQSCHLLRNDGNLFFTDVSVEAGIVEVGDFRHVGQGDINNDSWVDFAVGQKNGRNFVYRNNGDGTFTEVAEEIGLVNTGNTFGMVFVDFDNDAWMDVYMAKYDRDIPVTNPTLYLNNGDGTFRDVTDGSGMGVQSDMGHTVGDFDDDGHPDILAGTGGPLFLEEDRLYLITPNGLGGLAANDVSLSSGILIEGSTRQHGQPMGDIDRDGDLDVYANNGGPFLLAETAQENFLWINQGTGNHWVGVDLVGQLSNLEGVGTRLLVETDSGREIFAYKDGGKGFGNTHAPTVRLGLGSETDIFFTQLKWPSGIEQFILDMPSDQRNTVVETGITGPATAQVGALYEFTVYGVEGQEVDTITSLFAASEPRLMEVRGGFALLEPPVTFHDKVTIDASGTATASFVLPDRPDLAGQDLFVQTWIHDPGATEGGVLSNRLTVEMTE